jgi:hypothetical protein
VSVPENSGDIVFHDIRGPSRSKMLYHQYYLDGVTYNKIRPKKKMLIFFPPWLEHSVDVNMSDESRISIAFNVRFRNKPLNITNQKIDKIKNTNPHCQTWITERGTQFGYTQLIVDFAAVGTLKQHFDKVILDCTHSTQRLKDNGRTGGDPEMAIKYWKVADIFDYDGVFVETHPNPKNAVSDMDSQIPFNKMVELLKNEQIK